MFVNLVLCQEFRSHQGQFLAIVFTTLVPETLLSFTVQLLFSIMSCIGNWPLCYELDSGLMTRDL